MDKTTDLLYTFQAKVSNLLQAIPLGHADDINEYLAGLGIRYIFFQDSLYGLLFAVHDKDCLDDIRVLSLFDRYNLDSKPLNNLMLATIQDVFQAIDDLPVLENLIEEFKTGRAKRVDEYLERLKND
jgi:hypothetical protein